jgi:hypothetical protein
LSQREQISLSDVVNAGSRGNEPSDDYLKALDLLDNVVRECIFVSKKYSGILYRNAKNLYASVLFTSLITRGVSLVNLAPHS